MENKLTHPEIEITLQTTVADLLTAYPQAIPVFLRHHMACVGCSMSIFDTLDEATRNYEIPGDLFLEELRQAIHSKL